MFVLPYRTNVHEEQNIFICNLSIYRAFDSLLHTIRRGFCRYGMLENKRSMGESFFFENSDDRLHNILYICP